MDRMSRKTWLVAAAVLALASCGNTPGPEPASTGDTEGLGGRASEADAGLPLGAHCFSTQENDISFSGFSAKGVMLDSDAACQSNLCIVHSFQGRSSCPYGQTQGDLSLPEDHELRCRLPNSARAVEVPVPPQLIDRRAEDVVHCSCRCAGPDPDGEYCACPTGMECVELVPDLGLGLEDAVGSYCVRTGTAYDGSPSPTCSTSSSSPETDCGNNRRNP